MTGLARVCTYTSVREAAARMIKGIRRARLASWDLETARRLKVRQLSRLRRTRARGGWRHIDSQERQLIQSIRISKEMPCSTRRRAPRTRAWAKGCSLLRLSLIRTCHRNHRILQPSASSTSSRFSKFRHSRVAQSSTERLTESNTLTRCRFG